MMIQRVVDGRVVSRPATTEELAQRDADIASALVEVKPNAIRRINQLAELARQKYITPGAGKAMVYEAKRKEAELITTGGVVKGRTPFADKRAARKRVSVDAVGAEWQAKADLWAEVGALIEDLADGAIDQIRALTVPATFEADASAIINSIVWPTP